MMSYALNRAKSSGYRRVILPASEGGSGICRRRGLAVHTVYYEYVGPIEHD